MLHAVLDGTRRLLPKPLQVVNDSALLEVIGDNPTAGWQTGLDVGVDTQASLNGFLSQQPWKQIIASKW